MKDIFSANVAHMEITEEDIAMGYKDAGDEIVKAWSNFDDYLRHHPEAWQALADKLWDGFVNYKDVPLGNKEIWHEQFDNRNNIEAVNRLDNKVYVIRSNLS